MYSGTTNLYLVALRGYTREACALAFAPSLSLFAICKALQLLQIQVLAVPRDYWIGKNEIKTNFNTNVI
jgi:hypothetical protein